MRLLLVLISLIVLSGAEFAAGMDEDYYYEIGESLLSNGSYEEAVAAFDSSIAENGTYWNAWYGLAKAYYSLGKYEDGLELCDEVFDDPDAPQGESRSRFLVLDGNFYIAYWDKYHEAPITDPQSSLCSKEIPDNYQIAIVRYEDALRVNPNSTIALNSKGIALASTCQLAESIKCFADALSIDSNLAEIWNNKGVSLDYLGMHNESMSCYNRAIDLRPQLAVALMNRASTLSLNLSLTSQARENATQAIILDPSLKDDITILPQWRYIQLF